MKAINAKGCATFTRKEIDDLTDFVAVYRAKGLAWIRSGKTTGSRPLQIFYG
ncbi:MAG: GAD domain-containing protein [Desulfobacterales bacterium]